MSDIVAVVYNDEITATVTSDYQATVQSVGVLGIQGATGETGTMGTLESATNVDASNLENGSLLIYNNTSSLWVASRELAAQNMDAGEF